MYDAKSLMNLRNSPYSKTPTMKLPLIEGVTLNQTSDMEECDELSEGKDASRRIEDESKAGRDALKSKGTDIKPLSAQD